jgi:nitrogen-specific signal transduction histidine kinase
MLSEIVITLQLKGVSSNMDFDKKELMKALVAFSIEKVLLGMGKPIFEKVSKKLEKDYKCYIPDCYDHPEYLESVLKNIFSNGCKSIVQNIRAELAENLDDSGVRTLVQTIGRLTPC